MTTGFTKRVNIIALSFLALELMALGTADAQAPTGAIVGEVTDPAGAVIPSARVVITNKDTDLNRTLVTSAAGDYSAPALLAGVYEVIAEAPGFQRLARGAIVAAGSSTTVNLPMQLGPTTLRRNLYGGCKRLGPRRNHLNWLPPIQPDLSC